MTKHKAPARRSPQARALEEKQYRPKVVADKRRKVERYADEQGPNSDDLGESPDY